MSRLLPPLLALSALTTGSVARADAAQNTLKIVVENGPRAGTYMADAAAVICLHARKQRVFSVAFKSFAAAGPKDLAEAGIEVLNPDAPGDKHGNVRVAFGGSGRDATVYEMDSVSVTLVAGADRGTVGFTGKTPDGIRVTLTAACKDVENL